MRARTKSATALVPFFPLFLTLFVAMFAALFTAASAADASGEAPETPMVTAFDVEKGQVVEAMPLTREWIDKAAEALTASPVPYGGMTYNPKKGLAIHIPFPAPFKPAHPFYKQPLREVFLFLERDAPPAALLTTASGDRAMVAALRFDAGDWIRDTDFARLWNEGNKKSSSDRD